VDLAPFGGSERGWPIFASFPPLGVAFMYLYRTVQASPQPCQPDSKRPQV